MVRDNEGRYWHYRVLKVSTERPRGRARMTIEQAREVKRRDDTGTFGAKIYRVVRKAAKR